MLLLLLLLPPPLKVAGALCGAQARSCIIRDSSSARPGWQQSSGSSKGVGRGTRSWVRGAGEGDPLGLGPSLGSRSRLGRRHGYSKL